MYVSFISSPFIVFWGGWRREENGGRGRGRVSYFSRPKNRPTFLRVDHSHLTTMLIVKALFDYESSAHDELSFQEGGMLQYSLLLSLLLFSSLLSLLPLLSLFSHLSSLLSPLAFTLHWSSLPLPSLSSLLFFITNFLSSPLLFSPHYSMMMQDGGKGQKESKREPFLQIMWS